MDNTNANHRNDLYFQAVASHLDNLNQPVITHYQLALFIFQLHSSYVHQRNNVSQSELEETISICKKLTQTLLNAHILKPNNDFPPSSVFKIFGKHDPPPELVACIADPFAYVSHLSAMEYHGLTDRIPKILFLSSPPPPQWRKFAKERMQRDLGDDLPNFNASGLPKLNRISFNKIQKRPTTFYFGLHLGAFKVVKDSGLRVSTIGRTFLDMIRRPDLCGGIHHVIDVYRKDAKRYGGLIIDEVERHGKQIDKVRAGYILEELCDLRSDTIEGWQKYVQRGGSRKLDPLEEYSSEYSERWCLSLNM